MTDTIINLAHYPLCNTFADRTIILKSNGKIIAYLCRGCTMTYLGILAGVMLFVFLYLFYNGGRLLFSDVLTLLLLYLLVTPTIIGTFMTLKPIYMDIIRFLLGINITFAIYLILFRGSLKITAVIIFHYFLLLKPLAYLREKRNKQMCLECSTSHTSCPLIENL